jgi:hypothetical protein
MIFLEIHSLPGTFNFAHYVCTTLDATTVGFIRLQVLRTPFGATF